MYIILPPEQFLSLHLSQSSLTCSFAKGTAGQSCKLLQVLYNPSNLITNQKFQYLTMLEIKQLNKFCECASLH